MSNENNAVLSIILWHAQNKHESISSRAVPMDLLSIQFAVFYNQWQFIALFEFDSYSKMSRILFHDGWISIHVYIASNDMIIIDIPQ